MVVLNSVSNGSVKAVNVQEHMDVIIDPTRLAFKIKVDSPTHVSDVSPSDCALCFCLIEFRFA